MKAKAVKSLRVFLFVAVGVLLLIGVAGLGVRSYFIANNGTIITEYCIYGVPVVRVVDSERLASLVREYEAINTQFEHVAVPIYSESIIRGTHRGPGSKIMAQYDAVMDDFNKYKLSEAAKLRILKIAISEIKNKQDMKWLIDEKIYEIIDYDLRRTGDHR